MLETAEIELKKNVAIYYKKSHAFNIDVYAYWENVPYVLCVSDELWAFICTPLFLFKYSSVSALDGRNLDSDAKKRCLESLLSSESTFIVLPFIGLDRVGTKGMLRMGNSIEGNIKFLHMYYAAERVGNFI